MLTRVTYHKQGGSPEIWMAEYDESLNLKIIASGDENEEEIQFSSLEELKKHLEILTKEQEKNGFHLAAEQTFEDPDHPTVDELESVILLRYKLMGFTDTVLLKNARKEAMRALKNESGEREEFDLETMEFTVDTNDHDSLKRLLEWQLENFDEFINAVNDNYGISYGYIDEDGQFAEYEEDDIETYQNEAIIYREALKHDDLVPLVIKFIEETNRVNQEDGVKGKNEETPFGSEAAFQLAMKDVKYLRNYIDYCNYLEDSVSWYYDRYGEVMHIPSLFEKYGFDKNDPRVMELIAAQLTMRDNQHLQEELMFLMEIGLEDALEDDGFTEALFKAAVKRGRELVEYYDNSSITEWTARDLADSFSTLGLDANSAAFLDLITADDDIPTFEEFEEIQGDYEEDEEEDEDENDEEDEEDDDEEEEKKKPKSQKFKASEYKAFCKELDAMNGSAIGKMINGGIPLNEYNFKGRTAIDYFFDTIDAGKKEDKDYMKKTDDMVMLLINGGADVDITDFSLIMTAFALDLPQMMNHFKSRGFDINETVDRNGSSILSRGIYYHDSTFELLLEKGADPNKIPTALHDALRCLSLKNVKRLVEEYKVPLQNTDNEGRTPLEFIADYSELVRPHMEQLKEVMKDPKKKDKIDHNGETPAEKLAEFESRFEKWEYMKNVCKDLPSLYNEAKTPEEQAELDKKLLAACKEEQIKPVIIEKLLKVKADPNTADEDGQTPLHCIVKQTYPHLIREALDLLRKAGAKADVTDKFGRTPLFYFCLSYNGGDEVFKELVNYGIDPAHKDNGGYNALGYLISITPNYEDDRDLYFNCESSIQSMLYGGVPPVDINPDGDTLYHGLLTFADSFDLEEMFSELKKKGVDINAKNKNGDAALHSASKNTKRRRYGDNYVQKLVDAGADRHVTDAAGKTPLETSCMPEEDGEYLSDDYSPADDDDW
ncbi:MAG: ankyrin repeat domain-containing protein [Methanosarcinales archaeon]|jgi:ankyrin repeat protein|nr:ankyrin repeat domain-containing protein [Methanosarcinales archaeon]